MSERERDRDRDRERHRDGVLSLDCELQSGMARRARRGRSSAGTRREATSTSASGRSSSGTGKGSGVAIRMYSHLGKQGAARGGGDETSSALGPENGPSTGQISSGTRIRRQSGRENFEQAQQVVIQARMDLDKLMQEAPLPVMPVPRVSVSLVNTLEALTGIIENMWNPDAGQAVDNLIHAIQESRAILQTSSVILSQEGGAALNAEQDARQDPELWNLDEGETEQMAVFEEVHAPGGPMLETTRARKAAAEYTPLTPPSTKTRNTESWAAEQGRAHPSQVQRLSARAILHTFSVVLAQEGGAAFDA